MQRKQKTNHNIKIIIATKKRTTMEIRQLKYFVDIAECGSFTRSARKFYLSQSAISQQIKALEDEFHTSLFIRTPHKVEITASGQMLLPLARQVLQSACECVECMSDIDHLLSGQLNIGLTSSLEPYVRKAMIHFMKLHPQVHLNIYYKTIPELITMLRNGSLDIAFSIKVEGEEDWVESIPVLDYRICAIMRDTHPLANRTMLSFADLKQYSMVLPEQAVRNLNAIENYLSSEADSLRVRAVVNDLSAILNLLHSTSLISILSEQSAKGDDELKAIPLKELQEPITNYAHQTKIGHKKRSATEFLRLLHLVTEGKILW